MPVYQNSGPGLGEALAKGVQTFITARRQKKADELFQQDLEDRFKEQALKTAQLAQQGVHLLKPGELPPTFLAKNIADDASSRMAIPSVPETNLTFSPMGGAPTLQPATAQTRPQASGGDLFQQTLAASFAGAKPDRGPRYDTGPGYWLDRQPQWEAQDAARASSQGEKLFEATIQRALADQALGRSKDLAQFNTNLDIGKQFTLKPLRLDEARERAGIATQQAIDTERGVGPLRTAQSVDTARRLAPIEVDKALRIAQGEQPMKLDLANAAAKTGAKAAQQAAGLQQHFNGDQTFKDAQQVATAYQKIKASATGAHTATSDMSLVYGLMKMQDPGSTVREGEYASAENAKGVPDRVRNLYNKLKDGDILSDAQRQQFLQSAETIAGAQRDVFNGTMRRYSDIATRQGLDPRDVVFDPFEGVLDVKGAAKAPASLEQRVDEMLRRGFTDEQIKAELRKVP